MKRYAIFALILLVCGTVFSAPFFQSFNSGELSPYLKYRADIQKRQWGVETLDNFLVRVEGAAVRRPGTEYIATTKNNGQARLIPFEYSEDDAYVLEFSDGYLRFFRDGGQIVDGVGTEDLSDLSDIVAHWKLNETSGTDIDDAVASVPHDGTASTTCDALTATGIAGSGCLDLDAQYDIEIDNDDAGLSFTDNTDDEPFSAVCWGHVTKQGSLQVLLSKWRDENATREWRFSLTNDLKPQLHLADTSADITAGRVGQWLLDDTDADKVVDDQATAHAGEATSNCNTLTATGKTNMTPCFDFGGTDAVFMTNHGDLSFDDTSDESFSISAWVFVEGHTGSQQILSKWDSAKSEWKFYLTSAEKLRFEIADQSEGVVSGQLSNAAIAAGWHHVVVVYDNADALWSGATAGNFITLYVDGSSVASTVTNNATYVGMEALTSKMAIGAVYVDGALAEHFQNKIDHVILFNIALSQANISALYNSGAGTQSLTGNEISATADSAISLGWHMFAFTYAAADNGSATAANGIILYVDGAAVDSTATNNSAYKAMQDGAELVRIGSQTNSGDTASEKFWGDKIDEVSLFKDVLEPTEVASLYSTAPYEIETPFTTSVLRNIHYIQINDVMYLTTLDLTPYKLSRYAHSVWTIEAVDWEWGPFLDENDTTTTLTPSATTGDITLTASSAIFKEDMVGGFWKLSSKQSPTYIDENLSADAASTSTIPLQGDYIVKMESTGSDSTMTLEKSEDDGSTYIPVYVKVGFDGSTDWNVEYSGSEAEAGWIYCCTKDGADGDVDISITTTEIYLDGYAEITAYTSSTVVNATVIEDLASITATKRWCEGAWSDYRGWPRTIGLYQGRVVLAGTTYQPQGIWFSVSADPENMEVTGLDDGAIVYEVLSAKQNPILWLQDKMGIVAGTSGSIIRISSQESDTTLTSSSIGSERQSDDSSCAMQAAIVSDSVVFVDRNRRIVKDNIYNLESDSFVSPELTVFAEHITDSKIYEVGVQERPDPMLWYILGNGDMVTLTYDQDQSVVAWATQSPDTGDGTFESVAVIPGTVEDEVWFIVNRNINSVTKRYIERLKPQDWGTDVNDAWYLDCALEYNSTETATITRLSHLEGEDVHVFYGGTNYQEATVDSNQITGLDPNVTRALIGLPYTSTLQTFPIEVQAEGGYTVGHRKKVYEIVPSFIDTIEGDYGYVGQFTTSPTMYDIRFDLWPDSTIGNDEPYSGQIRLPMDSGYTDEVAIKFIQDEPYPFNLTSLAVKIEIGDD